MESEDNCITIENSVEAPIENKSDTTIKIIQDLTSDEAVLLCQYTEGEIELNDEIAHIIEKVQLGAAALDKEDLLEKVNEATKGNPDLTSDEAAIIIDIQEGNRLVGYQENDPIVLDSALNKLAGDAQLRPEESYSSDSDDPEEHDSDDEQSGEDDKSDDESEHDTDDPDDENEDKQPDENDDRMKARTGECEHWVPPPGHVAPNFTSIPPPGVPAPAPRTWSATLGVSNCTVM